MHFNKLQALDLHCVNINDNFWGSYLKNIRTHVLPYQWEALNDRIEGAAPSGCIHNFLVASGQKKGEFIGCVFQDSDLYKWIEAVAYSLMWHPDPELEKTVEEAVDLIGKAAQPDGYVNTYYIINGLEKRFTNLNDNHELYCLGHMIESAAAYYKATGKRKYLEIACNYIECVDANIGIGEGKCKGYPGHEVIEMALITLYGITQEEKHLKLAKYFIDERGQAPLYFAEERRKDNHRQFFWQDSFFGDNYYQAGEPVREQMVAVGHAVRAVYLYSGMADVAAATGDEGLLAACERLWDNITGKQMYVTGAIGASAYGEAFTFDYDLPNDTVYGETCAAIGLVFFARRMFEITKDSKYADVMERALYNGIISAMSLDGTRFFYVNPLEALPEASLKDHRKSHVKTERQKWFGCACCPPNLARTLASLGNYAYAVNEDSLYVNLYVGGTVNTSFHGTATELVVETDYPWDGKIRITVKNEADSAFTTALRIPGWCTDYRLCVNGEVVKQSLEKGYVMLSRTWKSGDIVELFLDMPVVMLEANPAVREDAGKVAVSRGPVVYCLEEADNGGNLHRVYLPENAGFDVKFDSELLGGVVVVRANAKYLEDSGWEEDVLYKAVSGKVFVDKEVTFIPYYSWTNRKAGEMVVWVRGI